MTAPRTAVLVVIGLIVTAFGTMLAAWDTSQDVRERLEERSDRVASIITLELERYRSASRAAAVLRADDPSQDEWVEVVERLDVAEDLASVFSVAAAVLDEEDGVTTLRIDRVAPFEPNRAALGLDLLTTPSAAPAARRALDEEVSLSDALTLVQEPGDQAGLVVYAPWYRDDGSVGGVTDLVMRGQDLLDALGPRIGDLGVVVTDVETMDGPRRVGALVPEAGLDEGLSTTRTIEPLGQTWELAFTAPSDFRSTTERLGTWLTLLGLLAVSALVVTLLHVLRQREEHARREVEQRTAQLRAANAELQQALAVKDEFLAVVSHEFRTPITVIRGFAETVATGRTGELSATTRQWLERIDSHARRLHTLMDNLLTTAQLQSGELTVEMETVDVQPLAEAVAAQHTHLAPLEVDVEEGLLAEADPAHLVRVLDSLLSNAAKYGRPPVTIRGRADDDQVVIAVGDSGDGVPAEVASRIFVPFEQADRGDRRESQGVGLGLAVVRELCDRMGGTVRLVDGNGRGAVFEVRLPAGSQDGRGDTRR